MAKTIDVDLLQKERDDLEKSLTQARQNVETAKNQVMSIIGAIQMTDRLIVLSKEGNYSRSRANSDGTVDTSSQLSFITSDQHFSVCFCFKHSFKHNLSSMA